eukprot:scaffold46113_cov214-Amphora_coffeaeformis.AAC.1
MPQSIAQEHGGAKVVRIADPRTVLDSNCGVEHIRIISNYDKKQSSQSKTTNYKNFKYGIVVTCIDGWVRNCTVLHFWESAVHCEESRYVTVKDSQSIHPVGPKKGGFYYSFKFTGGLGYLVYRCRAEDGRHDFVVSARTAGPHTFLKSTAVRGDVSEPHHRWGVGTLYDNVHMKEGGSLAAFNRGDSGTGHGWAAANTVFWNCHAERIMLYSPETEGENNFAIGFTGPTDKDYSGAGLWTGNTRAGYWGTEKE